LKAMLHNVKKTAFRRPQVITRIINFFGNQLLSYCSASLAEFIPMKIGTPFIVQNAVQQRIWIPWSVYPKKYK
jgi:hypothetical protein